MPACAVAGDCRRLAADFLPFYPKNSEIALRIRSQSRRGGNRGLIQDKDTPPGGAPVDAARVGDVACPRPTPPHVATHATAAGDARGLAAPTIQKSWKAHDFARDR